MSWDNLLEFCLKEGYLDHEVKMCNNCKHYDSRILTTDVVGWCTNSYYIPTVGYDEVSWTDCCGNWEEGG